MLEIDEAGCVLARARARGFAVRPVVKTPRASFVRMRGAERAAPAPAGGGGLRDDNRMVRRRRRRR